jgi:uncharacterized protein (DUF1800 family)
MRFSAITLLAALALAPAALAQAPRRAPSGATIPSRVPAAAAATPAPGAAKTTAPYDQERLLAGHLLRRLGFGPNAAEMKRVLKVGRTAYLDEQLNPSRIDDSAAEAKYFRQTRDMFDDRSRIRRWYTRMVYSRRQLQEKMTLVWHEHFATSNAKVGLAHFMQAQEEMLRRNALGSFRTLLVEISRDKAMLYWLDNNYNSGTDTDDEGNPIPPNENYGRELLQLFALGTDMLNMDGTPVLDGTGRPVPAYTEDDVKAVARALTGWYAQYDQRTPAKFEPYIHDSSNKTILGETVVGREGVDGMQEVEDVVDILMRHPSTAPFVAKSLIQKLATETPSRGYVQRVATVFKTSNGDLKATVRAIFSDAEFTSDEVVRSQFRTPIETIIGAMRALGAKTKGEGPEYWTYYTKHLVYYPPSVFSFYRPGQKGVFVNTAQATIRDHVLDHLVVGEYDTYFDAVKLIRKYRIQTPEQAVDYLSDVLLSAPLDPEVRTRIIDYMDGRVDEEKFRGAAWLVMISPDFQRN